MNPLTTGNSWLIAAARSLVGGLCLAVINGIAAYNGAAALTDASLGATVAVGVLTGASTFGTFIVIRLGFEGYLDRQNPDAAAVPPAFAAKPAPRRRRR